MDAYQNAVKRRFSSGGIPYLHTTNLGFAEGLAQAKIESYEEIKNTYKKQAKNFQNIAAKNFGLSKKDTMKLLGSFEGLTSSIISNKSIQEAQSGAAKHLKEQSVYKDLNVYQVVRSEEKRANLAKDIDAYVNFFNQIEKAVLEYRNVDEATLASIRSEASLKDADLKSLGSAAEGTIFQTSPKANTSMKKLLAAVERARQIGSGALENRAGVGKYGGDEKDELIRIMSGLVSSVTGSGFEVGMDAFVKNSSSYANEFIEKVAKDFGAEIVPEKSGLAGEGTTKIEGAGLTKNYAVNKGDVSYRLNFNGDGGLTVEVDLGLSLKDVTVGSSTRVSLVSGQNFNDFLIRTNQLKNNDALYTLMNGYVQRQDTSKEGAKKKSYTYGAASGKDSLFQRAKFQLAAYGALMIFGGALTRKDMAYFMVYRNKVISLYDLFNEEIPSRRANSMPSLNVSYPEGISSKVAEYKGMSELIRYRKSKELMMNSIKVMKADVYYTPQQK